MKKQFKVTPKNQFGPASVLLLGALIMLESFLGYTGSENNFLAENWGGPLIFLLIALFDAGWWFAGFVEHLTLSKGRKNAIAAILGIVLVCVLLILGSFIFSSSLSFIQDAMWASGLILGSGFLFRFSTIRPEVTAKLNTNN